MVAAVALVLSSPGALRRTMTLRSLAVAPDRQGTGLGSELLGRVEAIGRGLGCASARIEVIAATLVIYPHPCCNEVLRRRRELLFR